MLPSTSTSANLRTNGIIRSSAVRDVLSDLLRRIGRAFERAVARIFVPVDEPADTPRVDLAVDGRLQLTFGELVFTNEVRPQMHHHRCLDDACVTDPTPLQLLVGAAAAPKHGPERICHADAEITPHLHRHDIEDVLIAAVAIDHDPMLLLRTDGQDRELRFLQRIAYFRPGHLLHDVS